ncbi:MAG TPA: CCA tRNA nucleotidyltransferase, partial [Bdellovibrionota bacterium]|nr:CCA tRNA nucleotidyltransferase [Bdellovibrionota bacterium]
AHIVEVATFREDLEYVDHRHPKGVRFSGPAEDARRRDFTINALFYDPKSSRILDAVKGIEDLKAGVIRAIGEPQERFREDALRLLRAVRFATRFGFALEQATASAIQARSRLITKVSAERVRDELTLMWTGRAPDLSLRMLSDLGLLPHVLPELELLKGLPQPGMQQGADVWLHTMKAVAALARFSPQRSPGLAWATLLHDVGKPEASKRSGGKNFNGHELDASRIARAISMRLKMPRDQVDAIAWMVEEQLKFRDVFQMREATLQRFLQQPGFEEFLAFHKADAIATDGNLVFHEFCASRLAAMRSSSSSSPPRLIDGTDLIQLGFHPGPEFSGILRTIEDLAMERRLHSKEEALEYVVKHFVK